MHFLRKTLQDPSQITVMALVKVSTVRCNQNIIKDLCNYLAAWMLPDIWLISY